MNNGRINERNIGKSTLEGSPKVRREKKSPISEQEKEVGRVVIERILDNLNFNETVSDFPHSHKDAKFTTDENLMFTFTRQEMELLTDLLIKL